MLLGIAPLRYFAKSHRSRSFGVKSVRGYYALRGKRYTCPSFGLRFLLEANTLQGFFLDNNHLPGAREKEISASFLSHPLGISFPQNVKLGIFLPGKLNGRGDAASGWSPYTPVVC